MYIQIASGETIQIDPLFKPLIDAYTWRTNNFGYVYRSTTVQKPRRKSFKVLLHRELLGIVDNPDVEGDHIYGDRLDYRLSSLAIVTHWQNLQNPITRSRISQSLKARQ